MDPRESTPGAGADPPRTEAEELEHEDERLDEELDETFPASDPIPFRHDG